MAAFQSEAQLNITKHTCYQESAHHVYASIILMFMSLICFLNCFRSEFEFFKVIFFTAVLVYFKEWISGWRKNWKLLSCTVMRCGVTVFLPWKDVAGGGICKHVPVVSVPEKKKWCTDGQGISTQVRLSFTSNCDLGDLHQYWHCIGRLKSLSSSLGKSDKLPLLTLLQLGLQFCFSRAGY